MNSQETIQSEHEHILQSYDRFPLVIESGKGSCVYDIEGKKYIDMTSGIGVSSLGYGNSALIHAINSQINKIQHTSNVFYNKTNVELAEMLTRLSSMSKVFFCNSGAEANEGAIKLARKYSFDKYKENRNTIITLKNSFHGRTITTLAATGQEKYHNYFYPFTEGFVHVERDNIEELKNSLNKNVCAVMMEAVQGEGGIYPLNKEFAKEVEKLCKEKDILLIMDEIQCGIGRTGNLFGYETIEIKPDIVTTAKGLGGGLPIGAILINEKLKNTLGKGDHGSTFGGNPVAAAAAIEVLKTLSDDKFLKEVQEKGNYIVERLNKIDTDKIVEIRGKGLMLGVELTVEVKDILTSCIEKGALFLSAGKNVIRMLPPLVITYEEIDEALDILSSVLSNN